MNFIGRAVAGLESRLDQVLAVEPEAPTTITQDARTKSPPPPSSSPAPGGRMTMQERLALAMAKKNAAPGRSGSPANGVGTPSGLRTGSPMPPEEGKTSVEVEREKEQTKTDETVEEKEKERDFPGATEEVEQAGLNEKEEVVEPRTNGVSKEESVDKASTPTMEITGTPTIEITDEQTEEELETPADDTPIPRISIDSIDTRSSIASTALEAYQNGTSTPATNPEEYESIISQLRADLLVCESRRREENQSASERIDSLEEKIKYLARDSAEESRRRTTNTPLEKEVAKRDERIALLMEEGEKLSKMELKHMNTIKKLRAKSQDDERAVVDAKKRQERAERDATDLREKTKKSAEAEKRMAERVKAMGRMETEFEDLKRVRDVLTATTVGLKEELAAANARADDAENRVQTDALEVERKMNAELRATVENLQNDLIGEGEKHRAEIRTLTSKMERDVERARSVELELKSELSMLESKTEVLRTRAEEVSSGASGHAHAKLLRQIETLQSQYAIATGNWQGIEASLISRITGLEKERDDLTKKENDVRKKAREINLKSKRLEVDLETSTARIRDLETDIDAAKISSTRSQEADTTIASLKEDFDRERSVWQRELGARIDEERQKWEEEHSRPVSPSQRPRKLSTSTTGIEPPLQRRTTPRSTSTEPQLSLAAVEIHPYSSIGRRPTLANYAYPSSSQSSRFDSLPFRNDAISPLHGLGFNTSHTNVSRSSVSLHNMDDDADSIASPGLLSVSTVGAGPSVQLVERMSAAVRRLESEMAASREELSRMAAQRDEAREEVVKMMAEVDEKRRMQNRAGELEVEVKRLEAVQQTTLEMLGEKSEEVDELRADVQDIKQMYKDLVTQTTAGKGMA